MPQTDSPSPFPSLPDSDEIAAAVAEATARTRATRAWTQATCLHPEEITARRPEGDPARFNLLSLPAWLAVAARAGVAAIPAREIAVLDLSVFQAALDKDPAAGAQLDAFEQDILARLGPEDILRFEQVAPADLKHALSTGRGTCRGTFRTPAGQERIDFEDPRFVDTLLDLGMDAVRAYARPRYPARMIPAGDGQWPLEFRVFVIEGTVTGLSAYYPQAPVSPETAGQAAAAALDQAERIRQTLESLRLGVGNGALCNDGGPLDPDDPRPAWMPSTWGPQHLTLDFLIRQDGTPVFLEGGPGGLLTAHPCCFAPHPGHPADLLHGAVFAEGGTAVPLDRLPAAPMS